MRSLAQACIDTLRPLKTARQSVLGAPKDPVPGAPPVSNEFTKTQLGSAVPDAVLAPGAPRFVVCNRTAFKCVSARPATGGGDCEPVRGVRTPRAGSAFARLWDTRGRSSRERANAGGALAVRALVVAFTARLLVLTCAGAGGARCAGGQPHAVVVRPGWRGDAAGPAALGGQQ